MTENTSRIASLAVAAVLAGAAFAKAEPPAAASAAPPNSAAPTFTGVASPGAASPGAVSLDRLKALAGEWVAAEDNEMAKKGDLVARYAVSAGGTAVVETVFPGSTHEMVTVYHLDGPDLVLTHYCMEGNQPRMRAKDGGRHTARLRLRRRHQHRPQARPPHELGVAGAVGPDEIRNEWTEIAEGKPVFVAKSHLVRKGR